MAKKEKPVCDHFLKDVECSKCGKTFIPTYAWVYKETREKKTLFYCTWTCFNHRKEKGGEMRGRKKDVYEENYR